VSARRFLAELEAAGVTVARDGDNLRVRGNPGVRLTQYTDRIRDRKPALLAELLKGEIMAALNGEPASFNRPHYDELWHRLCQLEVQENAL
jgi:TubC N-terminal docking domain